MLEELDPILIQVTIPLPTPMIHAAFTDPGNLSKWLCAAADVEARVGGTYQLTFEEPSAFTSRGSIRTLTPDVDIGFSWEAPPEFAQLMNGPPFQTSVYVRLQDSPEGIDVTLEHTGWKSGEAWESARSWHFQLWDDRLHRLKEYLMKAAFG